MPREKKTSLKNKNISGDANDNEIMGPKSGPKKRRGSNVNNNQNNINNNNLTGNKPLPIELIPPQPISSFGDTIYASNPFDDTPRTPVNTQTPQPMPSSNGPPGLPPLPPNHPSRGQHPQISQTSRQSPNNSMMMSNNNVALPPGAPVGSKPMPLMSGKIYPPEQSMVFNPANPNAPPIYPCGVCHKEVHDNDQAILCESGCNFWYHRICSGLTDRAYSMLTQEVYAEWVCDNCANTKSIPLVKFKP